MWFSTWGLAMHKMFNISENPRLNIKYRHKKQITVQDPKESAGKNSNLSD